MNPKGNQLVREYFSALLRTPQIFKHIAFRKRTLEEELQEALLRGSLRKAFGGWDLLLLGLGIVIGSGWAQLTGAAGIYAGPAVIISYIISGLAALFAAACYAELCVEYPVSGGAFSYVMVTFGELAAYVTLAGLLLEYALGMAAVARGFSNYLALLCNLDQTAFIVEVYNDEGIITHTFDFMAAGIILLMSVLLSLGVRESAFFISGLTLLKIVLLVVISIVGYVKGTWSRMSPFLNQVYEVDGIFLGAALIFFSYTGFDAIGNAAEEVQNVAHLPWALMGTVTVSAVLYFMLALSLALMVTPNIACPNADFFSKPTGALTFISVFTADGEAWMQYVISMAALLGILTALTVGMFSVSRIVMVASRDWLLPPFLARVSPRTQTPLMAQMVFGVIIAMLAMMVEVDAATALVSFGTLIALWLVVNAQMYRRYIPGVQLRFTRYGSVEAVPKVTVNSWMPGRRLAPRTRKVLVWVHLLLLNIAAIALAVYYQETAVYIPTTGGNTGPGAAYTKDFCQTTAADKDHGIGPMWFALGWLLVTLSFQLCCPLEYEPTGWHVPWWLMPWLPSAAIGLLVFSVGALPNTEYWKVGVYFVVVLMVYLLFSLPMSYIKHSRVDYVNTEELNVVELAFVNGQWQPSRLNPLYPVISTVNSSLSTELKGDLPARVGSGSGSGSSKPAASTGAAKIGVGGAAGGMPGSSGARKQGLPSPKAAGAGRPRKAPLPPMSEGDEL